jgi:hypothetical protein
MMGRIGYDRAGGQIMALRDDPFARRGQIAVAILFAILFGVPLALWIAWCGFIRGVVYSTAAVRYNEYADNYRDNVQSWNGCYGPRWDDYSKAVSRDITRHADDKPYRETKSRYYRDLGGRYQRAARRPWLKLPPAPPDDQVVAPDPPEPE